MDNIHINIKYIIIQYRDLSTNNLDGEFPSFIGDMSSLKVM